MSVWRFALAGGLTGAANGLFGGGGGCVLVPLLTGLCGVEQKRAFALSVAVILPLCLLSVTVYGLRVGLDWQTALPYLLGGGIGGVLGGKLFRGVSLPWLRRLFGLILLGGGLKCLLF